MVRLQRHLHIARDIAGSIGHTDSLNGFAAVHLVSSLRIITPIPILFTNPLSPCHMSIIVSYLATVHILFLKLIELKLKNTYHV